MADLSQAISSDQQELTDLNESTNPVIINEDFKVDDLHITNPKNLSRSSLLHNSPTSSNNCSTAPIKISQYEQHDVRSPEAINHVETVNIPIFQTYDRNVFALITFPTVSYITSINGHTQDNSDSLIEYRVVSPYGMTEGSPFNERTRLLPGDYCLGLGFRTKEEAEKVFSITLQIITEPISNLMLGQILFNLYRTLGFEPSHALKLPVKATTPGTPFYRKTRNEINKVSEQCEALARALNNPPEPVSLPILDKILMVQQNTLEKVTINSIDLRTILDQMQNLSSQLNTTLENFNNISKNLDEIQQKNDVESTLTPQIKEIQKQLSLLENKFVTLIKSQENLVSNLNGKNAEKGSSDAHSITVSDFEDLVGERDMYYNKLSEAEDYIEDLQQQLETIQKEKSKPNFVRRNGNEWK